ncbi:MAG TPA: hypothetical protein VD837_08135 [Terriglobales bacterium]|nr:hypothetical protein [Terriglobales bacterium]
MKTMVDDVLVRETMVWCGKIRIVGVLGVIAVLMFSSTPHLFAVSYAAQGAQDECPGHAPSPGTAPTCCLTSDQNRPVLPQAMSQGATPVTAGIVGQQRSLEIQSQTTSYFGLTSPPGFLVLRI